MIIETVTQSSQNPEGITIAVSTILKFGVGVAVVMGIIYLIAVFTPKMAKYTDKLIEKHHCEKSDDRSSEIRSIYDLPVRNNDNNKKDNKKEDL